ncbi:SDR family oxidoreductase [Streptomyces sp. KL116D]|uniref:SDR family oxidoreductase n=1 Tax=Streptomyces sp. KL116D TaxID=3045152 RepID=UPI0035588EB0
MNIDYEGKTAAVTGAASGMGREVARLVRELGGTVYALDLNQSKDPVDGFIEVNLADKASIDSAVKALPDRIDSVFACAGVAGKNMTPLSVATINFVGHRHLVESLVPRMGEGSSIALIASMGGMGWIANIPAVMGLLQTDGFDAAIHYLEQHVDDAAVLGGSTPGNNRGYTFSKEATILYAKYRSWTLAQRRIRINTISPGSTTTPMLSQFGSDPQVGARSVSPIGNSSSPRDQAKALAYLNSDTASYISGADLCVDYGFSGGIYTGQGQLSETGN